MSPNQMTEAEIWRLYDADELRLTAPVSERMLELASIRPGMQILDLATGRGEPAIRAAHRVGPSGNVVGVDISERMLQMADERAAVEGLSNLQLHLGTAEELEWVPPEHFDATLARWGLMYMDAPVNALAAAHRALRSSGLIVAAVWAEPEHVPYFQLPRQILARYTIVPPIDPAVPGTFYYSDTERLLTDLRAVGFDPYHVEELTVPVMEANSVKAFIAWTLAFGMARLLNDLPVDIQRAWESDMVEAAESLRENGVMQMGGRTRLVVARKV